MIKKRFIWISLSYFANFGLLEVLETWIYHVHAEYGFIVSSISDTRDSVEFVPQASSHSIQFHRLAAFLCCSCCRRRRPSSTVCSQSLLWRQWCSCRKSLWRRTGQLVHDTRAETGQVRGFYFIFSYRWSIDVSWIEGFWQIGVTAKRQDSERIEMLGWRFEQSRQWKLLEIKKKSSFKLYPQNLYKHDFELWRFLTQNWSSIDILLMGNWCDAEVTDFRNSLFNWQPSSVWTTHPIRWPLLLLNSSSSCSKGAEPTDRPVRAACIDQPRPTMQHSKSSRSMHRYWDCNALHLWRHIDKNEDSLEYANGQTQTNP